MYFVCLLVHIQTFTRVFLFRFFCYFQIKYLNIERALSTEQAAKGRFIHRSIEKQRSKRKLERKWKRTSIEKCTYVLLPFNPYSFYLPPSFFFALSLSPHHSPFITLLCKLWMLLCTRAYCLPFNYARWMMNVSLGFMCVCSLHTGFWSGSWMDWTAEM